MKTLMNELDGALSILGKFKLSGDAVDYMAEAKRKIRIAKARAGDELKRQEAAAKEAAGEEESADG